MITSILGGVYGVTFLGCAYNMAKIRGHDDFTQDFKNYREFDFTYETIEPNVLPKRSLLHFNLDSNEVNLKYEVEPKMGVKNALKEGEHLVYSKVISFSNLLDPTMYYNQRFGAEGPKFLVKNPKSDQTMEIDFSNCKWTMFDLPTMALLMKYDKQTFKDR